MNEYPIGPKTQQLAAETLPGKLAILLNRVLYSAENKKIIEPPSETFSTKIEVTRWVAMSEIYRGSDVIPARMKPSKHGENYFDTEELMREIRDYLEFQSFKEVIP